MKKFLPEEIKKIALLDLRILNCDRNDGNILVRGKKLIPIDHGLCLPDTFEIYEDLIAWMNYPQVKEPLSEKEIQFVNKVNPI